ncbi:MAG: carboxypeptidase-like regulatory domain-containing protein, partial [Proteiniphilum sp.]|nr:carboxypeptidase-like regulatory domain-containing protein [Proteiniphilum sp.]
MKIRYYCFFLFFLLPLEMCCQVVISGRVTDSKNSKGVPDINVMLLTRDGRSFYTYTITGEEGRYKLSCHAKVDSLMLKVTGFNIKDQTKIIENRTQIVNLQVEE